MSKKDKSSHKLKALESEVLALRFNDALLEKILTALPGNVYWKDTESRLLGCNEEQARSMGYQSPSEIVGKKTYDLTTPEKAEAIETLDSEVMRTQQAVTREEVFEQPDGTEVFFFSKKQPLIDASGQSIGLLGVSIDITDQKKAEHLKQQLLIEAKTIESLKGLAGTVAHEMRTPLASIGGVAATLERVLPKLIQIARNAKDAGIPMSIPNRDLVYVEELGAMLKNTVQRSNLFIDNLLNNLNETTPDRLETLSVVSLVKQALQNYPDNIKGGIAIHFTGEPDFLLRGRLEMLMHILFNLLKNAIYYVQEAHKGEIYIWTELDRPYNILHFKDTGTGIAEEMLPNLFRYFFSKTRHGTGIGLAYAKLTMENIGGRITCESRENEYTHFRLFFPVIS